MSCVSPDRHLDQQFRLKGRIGGRDSLAPWNYSRIQAQRPSQPVSCIFQDKLLCQRALFTAVFTTNWKLFATLVYHNEESCRRIFIENKVLFLELVKRCPSVHLMEHCISSEVCTMRVFSELVLQYTVNNSHPPLQQCFLYQTVIRLLRPHDLVLELVNLRQDDVTYIHFPPFCLPLRMCVDLRLFLCYLLLACGASRPKRLKTVDGYSRKRFLTLLFQQFMDSVPSLQHLCRVCIREEIASLDNIKMLPLPDRLKGYVSAITMGTL